MRISSKSRKGAKGYVSYVMVLAMGIVLLSMLLATYKTSIQAHQVQKTTGLRIDYSEKEEAILRAVINLAPNRAIRAMQHDSDANSSNRNPLKWQGIFSEALDQANARTSVNANVISAFGLEDAIIANPGDAELTSVGAIFDAIEPESGYVSPGVGRSLGGGFPPPLESDSSAVIVKDREYPIITSKKAYGTLSSGRVGLPVDDYPNFNLLPYPEIRFGYAQPGEEFVAKRNWWAFSLDLADADDHVTRMDGMERDFVISIYEIPSQLAISAEAFTVLGKHKDGTDWQDFTVEGGVYSTRARVEEGMTLDRIAGRRGLDISPTATIGNQTHGSNPFAPGVREQYEIDHDSFLPVYLSSEAGRAGFIPINRGISFFDRYAHTAESRTVSPTTWNEYSVGAMQCAMRLDITDVESAMDSTPTELTFEYFKAGSRETMVIRLDSNPVGGLPAGYIQCAIEHDTVTFDYPVDVAYGKSGSYYYQEGVTGDVTFDNDRFGDPLVGTLKSGYYRPSYPFEITRLHDAKFCVSLYPERIPAFLGVIGADGTDVNHSIVVNVDHPGNENIDPPRFPSEDSDYGLILEECGDFSSFGKGFSLVTNLRLYIADDFNTVDTTPPAGSGLPTPFYPPCSLFAPEKRFGAEVDPFSLKFSGQMGSLAGDSGAGGDAVHLLDVKMGSELEVAHDQLQVNLAPIKHPAALPPITMMNWLVVIEERRAEFYISSQ